MQIKDLETCDAAMRKLLELRAARAKELAKTENKKLRKLDKEIAELDEEILKFGEENKDWVFVDGKVVKLQHGKLTLTRSEAIELGPETIVRLKELGFQNCITVRESANKHALKRLDDDELQKVEARRVIEDKVNYKLKDAA